MQRTAGAIGIGRPRRCAAVFNFRHNHVARRIGSRLDQRERFTIRLQGSGKRVEHLIGRAISGGKRCAVGGQHEKTVRRNQRSRRKRVSQPLEIPARQVKRSVGGVVIQFDKLRVGHGRIIHDLVDHQPASRRRHGSVIDHGQVGAVARHRLVVRVHAGHA